MGHTHEGAFYKHTQPIVLHIFMWKEHILNMKKKLLHKNSLKCFLGFKFLKVIFRLNFLHVIFMFCYLFKEFPMKFMQAHWLCRGISWWKLYSKWLKAVQWEKIWIFNDKITTIGSSSKNLHTEISYHSRCAYIKQLKESEFWIHLINCVRK